MYISNLHTAASWRVRSLEGKTTQVNARMATADHDRQGQALTDGTIKSHTVVEFASSKGHA